MGAPKSREMVDVAAWGPVEWAIGAVGAVATATIGFTWRTGLQIGGILSRISSIENRQDAVDLRLNDLLEDQHNIEKAIAALPGQIAERFDKRFDDLNLRIDSLLNRH